MKRKFSYRPTAATVHSDLRGWSLVKAALTEAVRLKNEMGVLTKPGKKDFTTHPETGQFVTVPFHVALILRNQWPAQTPCQRVADWLDGIVAEHGGWERWGLAKEDVVPGFKKAWTRTVYDRRSFERAVKHARSHPRRYDPAHMAGYGGSFAKYLDIVLALAKRREYPGRIVPLNQAKMSEAVDRERHTISAYTQELAYLGWVRFSEKARRARCATKYEIVRIARNPDGTIRPGTFRSDDPTDSKGRRIPKKGPRRPKNPVFLGRYPHKTT